MSRLVEEGCDCGGEASALLFVCDCEGEGASSRRGGVLAAKGPPSFASRFARICRLINYPSSCWSHRR